MKHKVELVKDFMYKGCELHWHCIIAMTIYLSTVIQKKN